ncbi:unnamed protein product [Tilletia controversa]|nr:unnamed protein product [Tilletia controversa]
MLSDEESIGPHRSIASRTRSRSVTPLEPSGTSGPQHLPAPHQHANTPRRQRALSLPSSPIEQLQERRSGQSQGPPAMESLEELADALQEIISVVTLAIPDHEQSRKWKPLKIPDLSLIMESAERGLALLSGSTSRNRPAPHQPRPRASNTPSAGPQLQALLLVTNKMQNDIKALTTAVMSRPTFAQVAGSPQAQTKQTNLPKGVVPPPLHPETKLPVIKIRHRVVLNTQSTAAQHPAKTSTTDQLLNRLSKPVQEAIGKRPLSVDRLRSGDIAVNLANQKEVEALLKASDKWIDTAFSGHSEVPTLRRQDFSCTRSLVVHGVPFRLGDGEELRKELGARNDATFTKSRWLTSEAARASSARQHGSVIVTTHHQRQRRPDTHPQERPHQLPK